MAQPYLAEIRLFPFSFAPRGYAICAAQLLPISQNTALFAILGTTYGGNGQTTFALPDLRGNVPVGPRQGPGLSNYDLGQTGGSAAVTLVTSQIPAHAHAAVGTANAANQPSPVGQAWAADGAGVTMQFAPILGNAPQAMNAQALGSAGGGQPHSNLQPYLALNYCIAIAGVFPSRN